jgi:hypothetical protein
MLKKNFILLIRPVINATIAATSLAIGLLIAEWLVRTYIPSPDYGGGIRPAFYSNLFEYDENLGWRGVPNLRTAYFSKDFHVTVSHDPSGYRNISPPYITGKNNFLLLGDSYAWGWGVEDNQTATAVFNSKNKKLHLYNLGIAGYGTDQEFIGLQKHLALNPGSRYKGAILLFYMNDLDDISSAERYGYPKPYYIYDEKNQLVLANIPTPRKSVPQDILVTEKPSPNHWSQKIQLINFAGKVIFEKLKPASPDEKKIITDRENSSIDLATKILDGIKKFCMPKKMFFHVVFLMTADTEKHEQELLVKLSEELAKKNIGYSFFYSKKFPRTDLWLDAHYTPYGQALLAEHIAEVIDENMQPSKQ